MPDQYQWASLRADNRRQDNPVGHLVRVPIIEARLLACSFQRIEGRAWDALTAGDPVRRCGRCQEAARTYLSDRILPLAAVVLDEVSPT